VEGEEDCDPEGRGTLKTYERKASTPKKYARRPSGKLGRTGRCFGDRQSIA
jgi:hypothetical protein